MLQIYFISIISNLLAGLTLISTGNKDTQDDGVIRLGVFLTVFRDKKFRLIIGIIAFIAGILKILSPTKGNILLIGDLLPAAAGLASGLILFFENFGNSKAEDYDDEDKKQGLSFLFKNRKLIGFATVAAAILHFFFHEIFLL